MTEKKINPIRKTNDEALQLAASLAGEAEIAALGVLEPKTGMPLVSRVAIGIEEDGSPFMLVSDLSSHSKALAADRRASLLIGEAGKKGDPLTWPRMTIIGQFERLAREGRAHMERRSFWLKKHPKAKLYIDFADFAFWRMQVERVNLNAGFGKAFELSKKQYSAAIKRFG